LNFPAQVQKFYHANRVQAEAVKPRLAVGHQNKMLEILFGFRAFLIQLYAGTFFSEFNAKENLCRLSL